MHFREGTGRSAGIGRRVRLGLLVLLAWPISAWPQQNTDAVAELQAQLVALRAEYEARISALEARLAELDPGRAEPDSPSSRAEELDRLRKAAQAAARQVPADATTPATGPDGPPMGRERNLNLLNPEMSVTGILRGNASDQQRDDFEAQEFELDLQAALDPFSRTRVTVAIRDQEVEIEEGYVLYASLPGSLELLVGRFRQRFGPLNRQHRHALPQSDYPLVYQTYFGDEGLAQTGLSLTWLLPRPWASANELTLEVTNGENEEAFGGELFDDLSLLGRLKNFWDLSPASYFEWGLSGIAGRTAENGDSLVWGSDFTYHWRPPARAKYREITLRAEVLVSQREDVLGIRHDAWGSYGYLEGLVARNLYLGLRADRAEDPRQPDRSRWGFQPYLTWWQSEYVRLRGEYGYLKDRVSDESENRFTLQLTWAAGPHKHETY